MSPDSLTSERLLADVNTDPRLETPQDRCTVLRALTESSRAIDKGEYARRCPEYPIDEYPWG